MKNKIIFSLCILILHIAIGCGSDTLKTYRQLTQNIKQYEKAEFEISLKEAFQNPYDAHEIALNMILTDASGASVYLPCYYEEGDKENSVWKARFAPRLAGEYAYYFQLVKGGKETIITMKDTFIANASDGDGFLHTNNFWTLKFDSGKPFRGIGENIGWESRSFEDPKWNYDYLLPTLSNNDANFFRSWMAPNNFPLEWKKVRETKRYSDTEQYFNPDGIRRLDEVLDLIDSLDLYIMLTFDSHNTLIQNNQWEIHNYNVVNGGPALTPEEFFTLKESREKYKNRLRYIVARWGYSTHIGAWEFFNEIDNAAFTKGDSIIISHNAITDWHKEMANYLKSIDPYDHIVTTSVSHREIEGLYDVDALDLNQMHIYKRTKQIPKGILRYTQEYQKPFSWGEFGYEWDWNKDFSTMEEEFDHDYKIGLWYGLFSPTPILPMTWWWEFFDDRNMTPYFKSVAEINNQMLEVGNGSFKRLESEAGNVEAYAVKTGSRYFICLINDSGKAEEVTVTVNTREDDGRKLKMQKYLPDIRDYVDMDDVVVSNDIFKIAGLNLEDKGIVILISSADH